MQVKSIIGALLLLSFSGLSFAGGGQDEFALIKKGEELFNRNCAKCHGEKGVGTKHGPPLAHKIYHPNHHADLSFRWAIERGVRAHHWSFGDMPKIDGVKPDEAESIIKYVRGIQKEAGIF